MLLLDTDIMIDVLRRYPPALAWLTSLGTTPLVLPGYVVMELIQGCRNKAEQDQLEQVLNAYQIVWPSATACDAALASFSQHRLSHSLGIIDALIGHTAIALGTPLYTFNQKHYNPITGLTTVQPYTRTTP
ncbi:MAG: type II toxin-antitoxin system VapC family toxin [Chloroflexota bacterium]|nr:type II toxin-antitoxin system VapC family toxin [Chloroflexota bacterium]